MVRLTLISSVLAQWPFVLRPGGTFLLVGFWELVFPDEFEEVCNGPVVPPTSLSKEGHQFLF